MVLPFVRDLFADVENLPAFTRAASHLKTGAPSGVMGSQSGAAGMSVSGLTPTAKALLIALLHRAAGKPLVVLVRDNRAADDLQPVVAAFGELTGALAAHGERGANADGVLVLPAPDVLPFEGLSPHPEIQEQRASTLAKIAVGAAAVIIVPVAAASKRLRAPEFYGEMARTVRRGETLDTESLLPHLNTLGYNPSDVVEMPGEYALRGGILDVYPPEADRPLRIELFGDEVESIRKFDPGTQRSTTPVEEVLLLPLTDVPVREDTLAAIHARLSGKRVSGDQQVVEAAVRAGGVGVFPGWEFYAAVAGAGHTVFDLLANAAVVVDEPGEIAAELDRWWERVSDMHARSGVGNLVRPEELYLDPAEFERKLNSLPRLDLQHLGLEPVETSQPRMNADEHGSEGLNSYPRESVAIRDSAFLLSQPTTRFHGSVPAMVEEVKKLSAKGHRVLFTAASTGEVERIADLFSEYGVPFRLGSRTPRPGESYLDDAAYLVGAESTTTVVKAFVPDGAALPHARLVVFGTPRPVRRAGRRPGPPAALQGQDLRLPLRLPRPCRGRLRGPRGARDRPVPGAERHSASRRRHHPITRNGGSCCGPRRQGRVHGPGICRGRPALRAAHAPGPGAEIPLLGGRQARSQPPGHAAVG